ncbi:MAG: type II toxin-antitoxin system death-on-curing family toxin [Lachnospiraceae bacterium]|nr:type II toxin-antitoxin system death-on-curing family toxin [Lachnospiraceae bacterium]
MLDSAVSAPYASFAGIVPFPTVIEKASRLGFGLIKNHPFIDGNKRIGTHALILMLRINGVTIDYDDQDLIDTILKVWWPFVLPPLESYIFLQPYTVALSFVLCYTLHVEDAMQWAKKKNS